MRVTDHQTMIREVCKGLGKKVSYGPNFNNEPSFWLEDGSPFQPDTDYNDCHLLIDWMVAAGWKATSDLEHGRTTFLFYNDMYPGPEDEGVSGDDPDFCIAVLTAAWRAVKS